MTTAAPLKVDLPVCPTCSWVSAIPAGLWSGKGYCRGPKDAPHARVRMVPRKFVEVLEDEGAAS